MAVKIEIQQEMAVMDNFARALIYEDGRLMAEIKAKVELKPGANGGFYPCVTLSLQEKNKRKKSR